MKEEGKGSVVVEVQFVQGRSWGANIGVGYGHEYGYVKSGVEMLGCEGRSGEVGRDTVGRGLVGIW